MGAFIIRWLNRSTVVLILSSENLIWFSSLFLRNFAHQYIDIFFSVLAGGSPESSGLKRVHLIDPSIACDTMPSCDNDVQELYLTIPELVDDASNVNIKKPSPEGVTEKCTAADLRSIPSVYIDNGPSLNNPKNTNASSDADDDFMIPEIELPLLEGVKDKASSINRTTSPHTEASDNPQNNRENPTAVDSSKPTCSCGSLDSKSCICRTSHSNVWCIDNSRQSTDDIDNYKLDQLDSKF